MKRKVCPICGTLFEPRVWYQKYCTHRNGACRKRGWQLEHPRPKKEKEFQPDPQAQFLGRYCEVCGEPLMGKDGRSKNKKTCSGACRHAKYLFHKNGGKVIDLVELPAL